MKSTSALAIAAATLFVTSFAAQADQADDAPYGKRVTTSDAVAKSRAGSFDVYIDKPTGFAFVNTPSGWKFARKVPDAPRAIAASTPEQIAKF